MRAKIDHSLTVEKGVSTMRQTLESVCLDRERVTRALATHLEALKLVPRPVLFHLNLNEAERAVGDIIRVPPDQITIQGALAWVLRHG